MLVVVLALVLLVAVVLAGYAARRRLISSWGGTFDCSLRAGPPGVRQSVTHGWMLGIGRYDGGALEWYRLFSLSLRPRERVARRALTVVGRREPDRTEVPVLQPGAVVVECRELERDVDLAMTGSALTGFLAWLEAAPPGQGTNVA
ncbi:DUF2550 family protein [Vallicoccus soli]|uniref:DUF2550 family protein n=1 Tax=Vallicoccus soli TaxID=2339232 RepID=A0A3A3ZNI8_9ACTN|nr:DUF2550 family protein [Vallicoccus soli]